MSGLWSSVSYLNGNVCVGSEYAPAKPCGPGVDKGLRDLYLRVGLVVRVRLELVHRWAEAHVHALERLIDHHDALEPCEDISTCAETTSYDLS